MLVRKDLRHCEIPHGTRHMKCGAAIGGHKRAGLNVLCVILAMALGGCSLQSGSRTALQHGATTVPAPSRSSAPSIPSSNPTPDARADAISACRAWVVSQNQISAVSSGTMRAAARTAATAAGSDSRWKALYQSMQFLALLPETGNSAGTIAEAQSRLSQIQNMCATVGVIVGS